MIAGFALPGTPGRRSSEPEREAGRARFPVHSPRLNLRQIPRSLRNLSVYSSAVVPVTELQVGDAYVVVVAQGVSRSSDQKCSPARPLLRA